MHNNDNNNDATPPIELSTGANPTACVIWLHGLGADGSDFEPIVPELRLPKRLVAKFAAMSSCTSFWRSFERLSRSARMTTSVQTPRSAGPSPPGYLRVV